MTLALPGRQGRVRIEVIALALAAALAGVGCGAGETGAGTDATPSSATSAPTGEAATGEATDGAATTPTASTPPPTPVAEEVDPAPSDTVEAEGVGSEPETGSSPVAEPEPVAATSMTEAEIAELEADLDEIDQLLRDMETAFAQD